MDCREAENLIGSFINHELESRQLNQLVAHMEQCSSCKEELSIQYLVTEGMNRLEDGSTFDLQKEVEHKLAASKREAVWRSRIQRGLYLSIFIMLVLLVYLFLSIYFDGSIV